MLKKNISWLLILAVMIGAYIGFMKVIETDDKGEAPVITFSDTDLEVSVNDNESKLLEGLTAMDREDGNVKNKVVIDSMGAFNANKQRMVTYAVFDSDGNVTKASRFIHYSDYTAPQFTASKSLSGSTTNANVLGQMIKATSCVDGDISNKINTKINYNINSHKINLEVTVSDSTGTSETEIFVYTYDTADYTIDIDLNHYLMYINQGDMIDLEGNIQSVSSYNADSEILLSEVYIDVSDVDINTPGVYEITYAINHNGSEGFAKCIVVVK